MLRLSHETWAGAGSSFCRSAAHMARRVQAVVRYYGIPSLSLRQAIHTTLQQQPLLNTQFWWSPNISNDQLHPNCVGHK